MQNRLWFDEIVAEPVVEEAIAEPVVAEAIVELTPEEVIAEPEAVVVEKGEEAVIEEPEIVELVEEAEITDEELEAQALAAADAAENAVEVVPDETVVTPLEQEKPTKEGFFARLKRKPDKNQAEPRFRIYQSVPRQENRR
ncbi:Signal recognition particle receptor protein FtsY [Klebsiella oxytoca]|nr:Signal recognition particle receptor protein FtsY [Klebsiella oxytoca]